MEENENMNNDFKEIFEIVNVHSTMALENSLQESIIQKRPSLTLVVKNPALGPINPSFFIF